MVFAKPLAEGKLTNYCLFSIIKPINFSHGKKQTDSADKQDRFVSYPSSASL